MPAAPVVGEDHSVGLERLEDHLYLGRIAGSGERGLEAHAHAHRWQARGCAGARVVPCRRDESLLRARAGEAHRVIEDATFHRLIVAHEPWKHRQPCSIRRGPVHRAKCVAVEVEHGAGPGVPTRAAVQRMGVVQLVQLPVERIHREHVSVARAVGPALDRRRARKGIRPRVALVGIVERHGHLRLRAAHQHVGNAVDRAEVWMEVARSTRGNQRGRRGIHGVGGHVAVPRVVGRKHAALHGAPAGRGEGNNVNARSRSVGGATGTRERGDCRDYNQRVQIPRLRPE